MILDAFTLSGKVAVVTGCDTGLGQGMAVALAQAGCDIVGVNLLYGNRKSALAGFINTLPYLFRLEDRFGRISAQVTARENIFNLVVL